MPTTTTISLILEAPASADKFAGAGHRRTAEELVRTIEQLRKMGGGAVGLEGVWGSGKSTVVKIATQELERLGRPHISHGVLTFDLWTYKSDDFRHSFLRQLLEHAAKEFPSLAAYSRE